MTDEMDQPDPTTGLTQRHKDSVRSTWSLVRKDMKGNGVGLFIDFFTAHPDYQLKFKSFADVPLDELKNNKKLWAHALTVMYRLSSIVDSIDDLECLVEMLMKLGESHGARKITITEFKNLANVVINFLKKQLGPEMTENAEEAWTILLNVANSVIEKGFEEKSDADPKGS